MASELKELRRRLRKAFEEMNKAETNVCEVQNLLRENLQRRRADAEAAVASLGGAELESRAAMAAEELRVGAETLAALQGEAAKVDRQLRLLLSARTEAEAEAEKARVMMQEAEERHNEVSTFCN